MGCSLAVGHLALTRIVKVQLFPPQPLQNLGDKLMTHKELFNFYQSQLAWINRRLKPDCLEVYKESADTWKHAKEVAFNFYQCLRYETEDEGVVYSFSFDIDDIPPYIEDNNKFSCTGILNYRDQKFPIYLDDNGSQEFIVYEGQTISISGLGGSCDWYYLLDQLLDKIYS